MAKRRRVTRRGRSATGPAGRSETFERLVDRALAALPSPFRETLVEVAIVIDEAPSTEQRRDNGLAADETLYGLYEGVPRTEWAADWITVPNRISLFRRPLEADFPDPDDLAEEVRITVLHELAHHLGIDDARLDELDLA